MLLIEHGGDPDHGIYGIDINDKNTEGFCEITKEEWTSKFSTQEGES